MVAGRRPSSPISPTAGVPSVHGRATCAPSPGRRVTRGLEHARVAVHALYGPLIQHALAEWGAHRRYRALATARRWHTDGLVRIAIVDRGRAIPLVGSLLEPPRSRVADDVYPARLEQVAAWLPWGGTVVLTAERGGADTPRMAPLARWGWHGRIRITGRWWVYRDGTRPGNVNRLPGSAGQALVWRPVSLTKQRDGPVHLALGRPHGSQEDWLVVSDALAAAKTVEA
jgi:hypothetical protein